MENSDILIVDDDRDVLRLASYFFAGEGIKVHCAAAGEEALGKIRERTFSMMITDLNMPGMDGLQLARKAREIAPDMPIVMNTGDKSPEICRLAKDAGIVEVFAKPFKLEEVLAMVMGVKRKCITPPAWQGRAKSENGGRMSWICPNCHTRYQGWSSLKKCYECGYLEDGPS